MVMEHDLGDSNNKLSCDILQKNDRFDKLNIQ